VTLNGGKRPDGSYLFAQLDGNVTTRNGGQHDFDCAGGSGTDSFYLLGVISGGRHQQCGTGVLNALWREHVTRVQPRSRPANWLWRSTRYDRGELGCGENRRDV
jgi:predicted outer membrane lipoprotein